MGLIIWQDGMFCCSTYLLTPEFEENITKELVQNVRRLRHHACLGLWSGNNELEELILAGEYGSFEETVSLRADYIKIFEYIIPKIIKSEDPDTFYWPSSPSSGGGYDFPNDPNREMHTTGRYGTGSSHLRNTANRCSAMLRNSDLKQCRRIRPSKALPARMTGICSLM